MLDVPTFNPAVSSKERDTLHAVWLSLYSLQRILEEMEAALDIFDTAEASIADGDDPGDLDQIDAVRRRAALNRRFVPWMRIAARNFSMAIYEHYRVSQVLHGLYPRSPWMFERIDKSKLGDGNKLFDGYFPKFGLRRQAVAHFGEHLADPNNRQQHAAKGRISIPGLINDERKSDREGVEGGRVSISESFSGRDYIFTLDGEVVSLEISQGTIRKLAEVTDLKFDAFRNLTK